MYTWRVPAREERHGESIQPYQRICRDTDDSVTGGVPGAVQQQRLLNHIVQTITRGLVLT